jgi:hypothetical protein
MRPLLSALTLPALSLLNLCGTSGGATGDAPNPIHQGPGWSLRVPAVGAKVEVEPERIGVDARDFSRWFDVRWTFAEDDLSVHPRTIAATTCDPAVFDKPVTTPDSYTVGGLCTRGSRFHWMIARAERHGDRALVFFYVANPDFVAFEDAWVDFARTAATLTGGPTPPEPPPGADLRRRIREAATTTGPSDSPLPGGGVLSTYVIPRLEPLWALRAATRPPPYPMTGAPEEMTVEPAGAEPGAAAPPDARDQ